MGLSVVQTSYAIPDQRPFQHFSVTDHNASYLEKDNQNTASTLILFQVLTGILHLILWLSSDKLLAEVWWRKKVNSTEEQVSWEEDMKLEAAWLFWIMDECQNVFW